MADYFLWPNDSGEPPTPPEIRAALSRLKGFTVTQNVPSIGDTWCITAKLESDPRIDAYINIEFSGDDVPHNIAFETGHELAIAHICAAFATICGRMHLDHPSEPDPIMEFWPNMTDHEIEECVRNAFT